MKEFTDTQEPINRIVDFASIDRAIKEQDYTKAKLIINSAFVYLHLSVTDRKRLHLYRWCIEMSETVRWFIYIIYNPATTDEERIIAVFFFMDRLTQLIESLKTNFNTHET